MKTKPKLSRFTVQFTDYTIYRIVVDARSVQEAIEMVQAMPAGDLWECNVIDGGQEDFKAYPTFKFDFETK